MEQGNAFGPRDPQGLLCTSLPRADSRWAGAASWPEEAGGTGAQAWDLISGGVEAAEDQERVVGKER